MSGQFETVAVPFLTIGNRQCLTAMQVAEEPWLLDFIGRFPNCFERSLERDLWIYYPDGDAPREECRRRGIRF